MTEELKPTNVRVEYVVDATINLGNFQNVKPGYRLSADVPEGTHPGRVREKLKALADHWLNEDIDQFRSEMGE